MQPRPRGIARRFFFTSLGAILCFAPAARGGAQSYARLDLGGALEVGGEAERYARMLQIAGLTALTPWSIQPFTPTQNVLLRPKGAHPWSSRFGWSDSGRVAILRPSARLIANSAFPFQVGNGPTWDGRGLTGEIQAGAAAQWGPLHVQIAPLAFAAQNASFPLAPNGQSGNGQYADPRFPGNIDAPQRFGDATYARLTPGSSSAVVDAFGIVAGLSTAPNRWGPEREYPLVLGPNAGGFPSIYFGTSAPWDLWLFKVHGRLVYGRLGQSGFAPVETTDLRLGEGIVGVIEPRGAPGLEIGVSRFLHRPWDDRSFAALARPFSRAIGAEAVTAENGVGSIFARWALPGAKSEFYGEFYKEDYANAFHNGAGSLVEYPDDLASFAFGFQHVFHGDSTRMRVLRGEIVNGESSHGQRLERGFVIPEPPYIHTDDVLQGHTLGGMILGSPEAYGGAGWRVGVDDFTPAGRRSIGLERSLRFDWLPGLASSVGVAPDVIYAVRFEMVRFAGKRDVVVTVIPAFDLNRNLVNGHTVFNLAVALSARGW